MIEIGSKYEENKRDLIERLRSGNLIVIEQAAIRGYCYFCGVRIAESRINFLIGKSILNGGEVKEAYAIHEDCYRSVLDD